MNTTKDTPTYLKLNNITAYTTSFKLSNYVWEIIITWDYFTKKTIGSQFARSIDSISANIAEGFGRYHKKDKVKFYYYSLGSQKESLDWNEKAKKRNLMTEEQYKYILKNLLQLQPDIRNLINYTFKKLKK